MIDRLKQGFADLSMEVTDEQIQMLVRYGELLVEWNEKMNLTAITDPIEIAEKHFLDSAMCLKCGISGSVIDVGTGAGFPGLVLKILKPDIKLCLLDSLQKRLTFLETVTNELGLCDVEFVHARAEDGGRDKKLREKFDFAVARAVANLSTLSEYCLPFVKQNGYFVAMKGPKAQQEIQDAKNALLKLGGQAETVLEEKIPGTDLEHVIVSVKKVRQTPAQYPRKAGKPSKEPL
ncbi:MAG: 16S rRNA (guanine(527)-N(7))-methyltransferase RsmG [Clostridia bacterium]|nr:16S rRNA (guanine(527)-N(7))-methyltransferase RsmG [Clostridia bacterium]